MINRETSCLRKLVHATYLEALQHATGIPDNDTVVVYGCEYCGFHHVGHSSVLTRIAKLERRTAHAKAVLTTEIAPGIQDRNRQRIRDLEKNLALLKTQLPHLLDDVAEVA